MDMFSTDNNSSFTPTTTSSPRLSFSHNLNNSLLIETFPYRSDSNSDFDFCFTGDTNENKVSSADELFRDGLIRHDYSDEKSLLVANSSTDVTTEQCEKQERSKEIVSMEGCSEGNQSKSFWRIKRSSSLHCESTKHKISFWSTLPLLSRSNSTGSVAKERHNKQTTPQKQSNKHSSTAVCYNNNYYNHSSLKPPLKRNYGGTYDYGVRISPVLNVTPPFISKSAANLLGLGSFFRHGSSDVKKKKK